LDFIGLNYYFYERLSLDWKHLKIARLNHNADYKHLGVTDNVPRSDMGWRTYPEGLYHLLRGLKKYRLPIVITENGIANARDDMRKDFVKQHLYWVSQAMQKGVDVRGYLYWSLTDNYEWSDGYDPRFGLVEINYETQERIIRPSASIFSEILNSKF
jgi:beta-glucosidase/6-phospho-beta-glucosidase/beta-galactosidase